MNSIALVGYGNMGREIEIIAKEKNIIIDSIYDILKPLPDKFLASWETAIEFTQPKSVISNIKKLAENGKNIVCGTTGWSEKKGIVEDIISHNDVGFVWASNFSIGMRMFYKIIEQSAILFDEYEDYDVFLHETHHRNKIDSPSGTALSIANILLDKISRKKHLQTNKLDSKITSNTLHVTSTRGGSVPGTHSCYFDSEFDTIELTHIARNRKGLAYGALKAAELISGQKGIFEFGELLFFDKTQ